MWGKLGLTLVLVLCLASVAMASENKMRVHGVVEQIDAAKQTFTVRDRDGKIVPFATDVRSEFEVESREYGDDMDVPFSDLKVGDKVRVKAYRNATPMLVDEVEIYRK